MPVISMFYGIIIRFEGVSMYWDVLVVKPKSDYRIYVEIKDGRKGIFDMKPYLDNGVFQELKDTNYFKRVGIELGAVTWPNQQDISPESLLAGLHLVSVEPR